MSDAPTDDRAIESSGNVFADIGAELDVRDRLKVDLALAICTLMEKHDLTQKAAAEILGTDQAKVSQIVRGRLAGFSVERLFRFVTALGYDIDVRVAPARNGKGAGELRMTA